MLEQCGDGALYFNPSSVAEIRDLMTKFWTGDRLYEQFSAHGHIRSEALGQLQFELRLAKVLTRILQ